MGQRITQRIYDCDICGRTPEDGEDMWEMYNGNGCVYLCESCANADDDMEEK